MQLVFDAMLLMPVNPTMLQARDAALAADLMRFGGANQKELWLGYAQGGMGVNASADKRDTTSIRCRTSSPSGRRRQR